MRKLFTLLALGAFAFNMNAQTCTPQQLSEPSFQPKPDSVDCFVVGQPVDQTFYFKIPATAGAFTIQYIRIDSVSNLPAGLTYELNKANKTYNGNENGCVRVTGTPPTGTKAGQYRLGINVGVKAAGPLPEFQGDLVEVANGVTPGSGNTYLLWVRLKESTTAGCPCIDTFVTAKDSIKAYNGTETTCPNLIGVGISNINDNVTTLSIVPNPFSNNAVVEFNAANAGTYTARITNIIGKEMRRETIDVQVGSNAYNINRDNMAAGVYFFSLSNGKSLLTKRFVIE